MLQKVRKHQSRQDRQRLVSDWKQDVPVPPSSPPILKKSPKHALVKDLERKLSFLTASVQEASLRQSEPSPQTGRVLPIAGAAAVPARVEKFPIPPPGGL